MFSTPNSTHANSLSFLDRNDLQGRHTIAKLKRYKRYKHGIAFETFSKKIENHKYLVILNHLS